MNTIHKSKINMSLKKISEELREILNNRRKDIEEKKLAAKEKIQKLK